MVQVHVWVEGGEPVGGAVGTLPAPVHTRAHPSPFLSKPEWASPSQDGGWGLGSWPQQSRWVAVDSLSPGSQAHVSSVQGRVTEAVPMGVAGTGRVVGARSGICPHLGAGCGAASWVGRGVVNTHVPRGGSGDP